MYIVVYKSSVNDIKRSKTNDYDELDRLRQLYERTRNDLIEQTRQNQLMRDFYSEQDENYRQEQIEYLIRILNLFDNLSNFNENNSYSRENLSLDEIKTEFNQQINYFLNIYKSLLIKTSKDKEKSILNDLLVIITKFQEKFSNLFNDNIDDEIILIIENENSILKNVILFLNDLYQHLKKILYEKKDLNEKLISIEKRNRKYFKWESKINQSISEDKHSSLKLKKLSNQIIEDYDQSQDSTNSRSTICSSSSPYSTIGKNSVIFSFY